MADDEKKQPVQGPQLGQNIPAPVKVTPTQISYDHKGRIISFTDSAGKTLVGIVLRTLSENGKETHQVAVPSIGQTAADASSCSDWHGDIPANGSAGRQEHTA